MNPRFVQPHAEDLRFVCQAEDQDVWISKDYKSLIARYGDHPCEYGIVPREVFRTMVTLTKNERLIKDLNTIPYYKAWKILLDNPEWSGTIIQGDDCPVIGGHPLPDDLFDME
jgi:hypothetical protein